MDLFCTDYLGSSTADVANYFAKHFSKEGMKLKLSNMMPNSFQSHRLIHYAHQFAKQNEISEVIFRMYWLEGKDIGHNQILSAAADEVGLPNNLEYLKSNESAIDVRDQEREQMQKVSGVPLFTFNNKMSLSGAQSISQFEAIFDKLLI